MKSGQSNDAYEAASYQHVKAGKAVKQDYTTCSCGFWTIAEAKQNGVKWTCGDMFCKEPSRFEKLEWRT